MSTNNNTRVQVPEHNGQRSTVSDSAPLKPHVDSGEDDDVDVVPQKMRLKSPKTIKIVNAVKRRKEDRRQKVKEYIEIVKVVKGRKEEGYVKGRKEVKERKDNNVLVIKKVVKGRKDQKDGNTVTCELCNRDFGSERGLKVHLTTCKKKHPCINTKSNYALNNVKTKGKNGIKYGTQIIVDKTGCLSFDKDSET